MSREIKFRCWFAGMMHYNLPSIRFGKSGVKRVDINHDVNDDSLQPDTWTSDNDFDLMQFVGRKDKKGKDIYEGDIFRIEEDADHGDIRIYVVIVWIQEWCMFATLRVDDEYPAYLKDGVKALDEPMFWTYTLEDTDSRKHFLCGNIHQTPELLLL